MNLAILQARMGSSRLPGKVLKKVNDIPLLKYQCDRLSKSKKINQLIIATSIDTIDNEIVFETWFGENDIAESFINYIFSPGFISRDYSYFTEIYYTNGRPSAYKFTTMNDYVIGAMYLEYDEKDHLIKETWCKGETSKKLREFTSTFDPAAGGYKLIERDRNGDIVHQEIVLSSNE